MKRKQFKQYRNRVNQLIRTSKIKYFERKINQKWTVGTDGQWKSMKIINVKQLHNELNCITTKDGMDLTDNNEIPDYFFDYYTCINKTYI